MPPRFLLFGYSATGAGPQRESGLYLRNGRFSSRKASPTLDKKGNRGIQSHTKMASAIFFTFKRLFTQNKKFIKAFDSLLVIA
jgi:hypothetical protein